MLRGDKCGKTLSLMDLRTDGATPERIMKIGDLIDEEGGKEEVVA